MFKISKEFNLEFGHRVHTQSLNHDFCAKGDTKHACRFLHGHSGIVTVSLEADKVDRRGMVTDFKELGWFKDFIDDNLDHKFIIDRNDPLFTALVSDILPQQKMLFKGVNVEDSNGYYKPVGTIVNLDLMDIKPETPIYELLEGYFIVDFVPTSENLSKWLFDIVQYKMKDLKVKVSEVSWKETAKSIARYHG